MSLDQRFLEAMQQPVTLFNLTPFARSLSAIAETTLRADDILDLMRRLDEARRRAEDESFSRMLHAWVLTDLGLEVGPLEITRVDQMDANGRTVGFRARQVLRPRRPLVDEVLDDIDRELAFSPDAARWSPELLEDEA